MNKIAVTDKIQVENMIYEIRGKQAMLDSEIYVAKCNGNKVTHHDFGKPISNCNYNFADVSAKLLR